MFLVIFDKEFNGVSYMWFIIERERKKDYFSYEF